MSSVDPTGQNHQVELPEVEDEGHDCRTPEISTIMR